MPISRKDEHKTAGGTVRSGDSGLATLCSDYVTQLLLLPLVGRSWVNSCSGIAAALKVLEYHERRVRNSVAGLFADFRAGLLDDVLSLGVWRPQKTHRTRNKFLQASRSRLRCGKTTAEI